MSGTVSGPAYTNEDYGSYSQGVYLALGVREVTVNYRTIKNSEAYVRHYMSTE